VLLDKTPLPQELMPYQWVDFREPALRKHGLGPRWLVSRLSFFLVALVKVVTDSGWLAAGFLGSAGLIVSVAQLQSELNYLKVMPELRKFLTEKELGPLANSPGLFFLYAISIGLTGGYAAAIVKKAIDAIAGTNAKEVCDLLIQGLRERGFATFLASN
jgi:hypothetical protein